MIEIFKYNQLTDFEKNLFLKRQIKELKEENKLLKIQQGIKEKDVEIGVLTSERDEWKHRYDQLVKDHNKNQNLSKTKIINKYEKVIKASDNQLKSLREMQTSIRRYKEKLKAFEHLGDFELRPSEEAEAIKNQFGEIAPEVVDKIITVEAVFNIECAIGKGYYQRVKEFL